LAAIAFAAWADRRAWPKPRDTRPLVRVPQAAVILLLNAPRRPGRR